MSQIPGYHECDRDWHIPLSWAKRIMFGLEIETSVPDRFRAWEARPVGNLEILGEEDGSLSPETGIEWVGPPMPIERYRTDDGKDKNPWIPWLGRLVRDFGAVIPDSEHGMHVNISRAPIVSWDLRNPNPGGTTWERRFLDTFNSCCTLVQWIAGRLANNWARFEHGTERYSEEARKYRCANVRREVIECRIFRATLDPARMLATVQFCYAMLMWTKAGSCATGDDCDARLVAWIRDRPDEYLELVALLASYDRSLAGVDRRPHVDDSCGCEECGCESCYPDGNCGDDECDSCNPCNCAECGCERCYPERPGARLAVPRNDRYGFPQRYERIEAGECRCADCERCNPPEEEEGEG